MLLADSAGRAERQRTTTNFPEAAKAVREKPAQTICANAPALSSGCRFAFLLRPYSATPPLRASLPFLCLSTQSTHSQTRTRTQRDAIDLS